jgi:uncharacterized protein
LKLFIDTWGWLTLRDKSETRHEEVKDLYQRFRNEKARIYTSDYVLDETITLLFKRLHFDFAKASLSKIDKAIQEGYIRFEWITPERFEKAKTMRKKYQDKPKIFFTDFTSMVVMKELGVVDILTSDDHFEQVGLGFQLKP